MDIDVFVNQMELLLEILFEGLTIAHIFLQVADAPVAQRAIHVGHLVVGMPSVTLRPQVAHECPDNIFGLLLILYPVEGIEIEPLIIVTEQSFKPYFILTRCRHYSIF